MRLPDLEGDKLCGTYQLRRHQGNAAQQADAGPKIANPQLSESVAKVEQKAGAP